MPNVIVNAPAKINLRLKVVGKRKDGYHFLSMLNEKLILSDRIMVHADGSPSKDMENFPVKVICEKDPSLATESNLVVKAARRFAEKYEVATPLTINIDKNIPIGAGLGGGSSDAAAVIKALNTLWGLYRPYDELAELGVTIGADVPFFFCEGPAHVTGIGDFVDPHVTLPKLWVLLVNPGFEVSTREVYGMLDLGLTEKVGDDSFRQFFNDLGSLSGVIDNDLERVVEKKHSEINEIERYLTDRKARIAFMSGSGPTVVGIFDSRKDRDLAMFGPEKNSWKYFPTENVCYWR